MSLASFALVLVLAPASPHASHDEQTRRIGIAGGVVFGLGVVAAATAIGLVPRRNDLVNDYYDGASPAVLGFPGGRYADFRETEREINRLNLAIPVLAWTGAALIVGGTTVLIVYGVRHRRARGRSGSRVAFGRGLSLRF